MIFLITSNTRDTYFDNNTVAFNNCQRVVGVQNRPPENEFRNVWFRNNIFWENTGGVGADRRGGFQPVPVREQSLGQAVRRR